MNAPLSTAMCYDCFSEPCECGSHLALPGPAVVPRRTKRPVFAGAWAPVTFTRFRCHSADEAKNVRKRVQLNDAGALESLTPDGFFNGYAETVSTTLDVCIRELQGEPPCPEHAFYTAGVSSECKPGESLLMGNLGDDKRRSRSKKGFPFPERDALLAIDTDNIEAFPGLQTPEDVVDVLAQLGLDADCGASPSGSSYLEWPGGKRGLRGLHTFYSIDQGAEIPRVLDTLQKRAWLAGYGRIVVGSDGKLHERSIVDRALASGNQPIFEFGAVLLDKRIQQPRKVSPFRGRYRQVVAADILPLTEEQEAQYKALVVLAKAEKQGDAEKATEAWIERRTAALPEAERDAARAALLQQRDAKHKDLPPSFPLQLNDGGGVFVSAILADPDTWHRVTLPDPLEPEYGNAKATIFTQEQRDGRPKIVSRAHGVETVYFLDTRPGSFDADLFDGDDGAGEDGVSEFDGPELALLDEIALVKMGSKSAVLMLDENSDDVVDTMIVQGARDYFAPRQVLLPGEGDRPPRQVPEFNLWLKHPQRRTLRGLEFAPDGKVRPGYFNLWRGFAVTPAEGRCARILQHIREVICAGNEEHYQWLVRWMAHAVQCPTEKPGTAIVLRGREGTGKNVFAEAFGELFGRAFFKASRMEHLVQKHNKHLAGRLVVFSNEAVWGGNKSDEGALKDLITEREQQVEPKGLDAFQIKDYSRHILATNESWAVPAGMDARRWFVLDVSDSRMRDYPYFEAIKRELQEGGKAALLHYLMNLDLTGFNVRDAPLTEGLLDQKQRSLSSVGQWWFHVLMDGFPEFTLFDDEGLTDADGGVVGRDALFQDYRDFATKTGHGKYLSTPNLFGVELRKMLPALEDFRPRVGGRRVWCYRVPSLRDCRSAFDNFMRQPLPWPADDEAV
ncbi:DUF5906 domain-containing protein [Thauera sp.]|uniref:DUF5906 domain-containing protein n=1 Tax=Thauera sp. TaxID=1905334 RepID=UPI001B6425CB|nr:DUF5906 domain-containing protein [Thauera sp.]MBP6130890.1 hypothetical protein [Thauera sp.]MBP7046903.1 hypothetical protein [Thauera sp.]